MSFFRIHTSTSILAGGPATLATGFGTIPSAQEIIEWTGDLAAVGAGIKKWTGTEFVLATAQDQADYAVAIAAEQKAAAVEEAKALWDVEVSALKATILALLDEVNALRARVTLNQGTYRLKQGETQPADMEERTPAQARTAIRNKADGF